MASSSESKLHHWKTDFNALKKTPTFKKTCNRIRNPSKNRPLGRGTFGKVSIKFHGQRAYAVKQFLDLYHEGNQMFDFAIREVDTFARIKHPCLFPICWIQMFRRGLQVWMPLAAGNIFDLIFRRHIDRTVRIGAARIIFWTGAHALLCLHRQGILHRDIKPENFLYGPHGIYLSDFSSIRCGNAYQLDEEKDYMTSQMGTYYYRPPEMYKTSYGAPSEMYALCTTCIHLICGDPDLFEDSEGSSGEHRTTAEEKDNPITPKQWKDLLYEYEEDLDPPFFEILREGIKSKPEKRLTLQDALSRPYFVYYNPGLKCIENVRTFPYPTYHFDNHLGSKKRSQCIQFMMKLKRSRKKPFQNMTYIQAVHIFDDLVYTNGFLKKNRIGGGKKLKVFSTLCVGISAKYHSRVYYDKLFLWDTKGDWMDQNGYLSETVLKIEEFMYMDLDFIVVRRKPKNPLLLRMSYNELCENIGELT